MKHEEHTPEETQRRFDAILRGAMHKPTPHKDVSKQNKKPLKRAKSKKKT